MSYFGENIPNRANFFSLKFRKCTKFIIESCCRDSATSIRPPIRYRIENMFTAHKEKIISQSSATIYHYNRVATHQNLRFLKRFDMFIDIKTQQNTICLNPLFQFSLRKIGIIS